MCCHVAGCGRPRPTPNNQGVFLFGGLGFVFIIEMVWERIHPCGRCVASGFFYFAFSRVLMIDFWFYLVIVQVICLSVIAL